MSVSRPKLTRRRGACEECRQKKIRCNGANPCNHCERNASLCEYNPRRSVRCLQGENTQSRRMHAYTATEQHTVIGNITSSSPDPNHSPEIIVTPAAERSENPLVTPFSETRLSQAMSDGTHSFVDFGFLNETMLDTRQDRTVESDQQVSHLQNQTFNTPINDTSMIDWLALGYSQNLHQHSTTQLHGFLENEIGNSAAKCSLTLFSGRMVADKAETKPFPKYQMYGIISLFENIGREDYRQQAVSEKVRVLLSSEHQYCLSNLLRKASFSKEHQSLDLNCLPMEKLVQRAFTELGGLNVFVKKEDVTNTQERFLDPEKLPIDISDMSLLVVSLAWGAMLDPEASSVSRLELLDTVLEVSRLLLCQNASIGQFLGLVATLCLAEKSGSENLLMLITGSVSTAAFLGLHSENMLRSLCVSGEQAVRTKRAMWILYCIDKSYALRWQTFPLVSDALLTTAEPPENTLQSDFAATSSLEWLKIRSQYSRICSDILQLRRSVEQNKSRGCTEKAAALSTALEEWNRSVSMSQMMLCLDNSTATRIKLQISYFYHEARLQLAILRLPNLSSPSPIRSQQWKELLKPSVRAIITSSSTMSSEHLLQDYNHLFVNKLALCLLALDVLLESEHGCGKENRALLSIVIGTFARVDIVLPESSVFREVSSLVEILTYR